MVTKEGVKVETIHSFSVFLFHEKDAFPSIHLLLSHSTHLERWIWIRRCVHACMHIKIKAVPNVLCFECWDIIWIYCGGSEDQHVNHINYTPTWKHRWSSNKEKSAGFTGNLNSIFLKTCSVDPRVAGMHVLILEKLVMWHHCAHCFQRPQRLTHAINYIGISNQVESVAIWDRNLCWNGVALQLACGLTETQISIVLLT